MRILRPPLPRPPRLALCNALSHANKPDARLRWLVQWISTNLAPDGRWNDSRLVLLSEFEDARRWLQKRLTPWASITSTSLAKSIRDRDRRSFLIDHYDINLILAIVVQQPFERRAFQRSPGKAAIIIAVRHQHPG